MKIKLNFYNNVKDVAQYIAHVDDGKLISVTKNGKEISQKYGKRLYNANRRGIKLLSEARGHKEEIPKELDKFRGKMHLPKITGETGFDSGDFVPYNTKDMDREIYIVLAANPVDGVEYWAPESDETYQTYYLSTGYTNQMMLDDGLTLDRLGTWKGEDSIERGDQIVGYMFFHHDTN